MRARRACMRCHGVSATSFLIAARTPSCFSMSNPHLLSTTDAAGYMFSSDVVAALEKYGNELVNSVMERTEAIIRNYGTNINVERITGSGDAKDVICSTVGKLGADTLVMGSHGYGFFKRALLGSVSDYCAKHVKCPVVIVKHPEDK
ncbi:hypothetical protein SLA2020_438910 [Shorea laevis]